MQLLAPALGRPFQPIVLKDQRIFSIGAVDSQLGVIHQSIDLEDLRRGDLHIRVALRPGSRRSEIDSDSVHVVFQAVDLDVVDLAIACRGWSGSGHELLVEEGEGAFVGQRCSGR